MKDVLNQKKKPKEESAFFNEEIMKKAIEKTLNKKIDYTRIRRTHSPLPKKKKNPVITGTRRPNGTGSIYQRTDGLWVGKISMGTDESGRRKRKTVYGKSQTEIAKKLSDISGRILSNSYEDIENKTIGKLMLEWLLVFKKNAVSPRTFEGIIRNYRLHIEPQIGNMKLYEIDTFVIQKVINNLIEQGYSNNVIKKNKHLISQFFEYVIDNKWMLVNPTLKVQIRVHDRKVYDGSERYKALTPEIRLKFLETLNKDESNFIKPMCIVLMFAGLRIGEACALTWENIDFENKTLKIERAITTIPKFDSEGNILNRVTVISDTKTTCSVREIPIADIVVETLKTWKGKQSLRQQINKEVKADLTAPTSFIFANDDGSVRSYSGCRMIFNRFIKRNNLSKYNIHFHGLRHTFSNMHFEMNENPKVIQQLLGHRDVKTTITVYNSVDNEYVRQTTEKFNEKLKEEQLVLGKRQREEIIEERKEKLIRDMSEDEFDDLLEQLMIERRERKQKIQYICQ